MAKGDKLDISTIKKYLASGTFAARFVTNKDINNEHGEGVSTLMNILVDESLSFMPFIKLPVFPADEDAREDIFYIIDDELYIFEAPNNWIQLVGGSGGSGEKAHQFVEALPTNPKNNVEYIVMKDIADCSSFTGSFVWNSNANCWVNTSGAGQGINDKYTFEKTSTGWLAKKNGTTIFTYSDQRIIQNQVDIKDIQDDIYGDYLVNRIEVCPNTPLVLTVDDTDPKKKKIKLCLSGELGDKSDGAYEIKGELSTYLSTALLGTTPVHAANVPDLDTNDIVIGETYLYDHQGTLAVVIDYDPTTDILTAQTMTTSPGERSGVRLGAVEEQADLPTTLAAATALGWLTPVEGDFAYVRQDGPNGDKLGEWLVQSIDASGNITWSFSHYINAGNYVVDVNLSDGTLIPKNPDGTVTLPNYVRKIELDDGTVLPVDAQGKVTLPDFCELKGVRTADGTLLTIAADKTVTLPDIPEKFNTYKIETTLENWVSPKTDIDTLQDIDPAKLVDIIKKGSSMTTANFVADVTPNRDLIYVHGKDKNNNPTQEAIAWFVSYSASTGIKLRILAIPRQDASAMTDKEVPEYTRDLYAGDKINKLELITYDDVLYRATTNVTLTGNWLTDRNSFELVNMAAQNVYYNIARSSEELGSIYCEFKETQLDIAHSQDITFEMTQKSANKMSMSGVNGIVLKAGKRYQIDVDMTTQNTAAVASGKVVTDMYYFVMDSTNNVRISQAMLVDRSDGNLFGAGVVSCQYSVPDTGDIVLKVTSPKTARYNTAAGKVRSEYSHITVHEIGRIVDPISYLNGDGNAEEMPVGSIIEYFGKTAPAHYLVCDGATYNVGTYPALEAFIAKEYGTINYFGGNGSTTWAVPNLQGEFLRGAGGTASATRGAGSTVGAHQNPTQEKLLVTDLSRKMVQFTEPSTSSSWNSVQNADFQLAGKRYLGIPTNYVENPTTDQYQYAYTARPTNTSVLMCIKYEPTPKVVVDNGSYKVQAKATFKPSVMTETIPTFTTDIVGDTSMVSGNSIVIPVDGFYAVSFDIPVGQLVNGTLPQTATYTIKIKRNNFELLSDRGTLVGSTTNNGFWSKMLTAVRWLQAGDVLTPMTSFAGYTGGLNNDLPAYLTVAMVTLADEKNVAEIMNKPNLWTAGIEQSFGDGIYGLRLVFNGTTSGDQTISLSSYGVSGITQIDAQGGCALVDNLTVLATMPCFYNSPAFLGLWYNKPNNILHIYKGTQYSKGNEKFDIWILYRK